jgi:hypothetical protein
MHPEIFHWGVLHIRSYGLMLALAFLVGTAIAVREARRLSLDEDQVVTVILIVLIASVLGARALYVLEHIEEFRRSWGSVIAVWQGGLTFYGGLIAGTVAGLLSARRMKLPMWTVADALTPSLALGTAFGRGRLLAQRLLLRTSDPAAVGGGVPAGFVRGTGVRERQGPSFAALLRSSPACAVRRRVVAARRLRCPERSSGSSSPSSRWCAFPRRHPRLRARSQPDPAPRVRHQESSDELRALAVLDVDGAAAPPSRGGPRA